MTSRAQLRSVLPVAALAVTLAGCPPGTHGPVEQCSCEKPAAPAPVDVGLMALLSKSRAVHHQADLREDQGDLRAAIEVLDGLLATVPDQAASAPEVREVLADTRARVADLRSQLGEHDRAESDIEDGLRRAPPASYFEGHLHEVRGVNEQRRAAMLAARGDTAAALEARERAIEAFDRAVRVQDAVIRRILDEDSGP